MDLIFLDVNMPNLTGIQFLKALKKKPLVVFTTAYSSYAAESYEYDAVDYLVKPIVFERFLKAVSKARGLIENGSVQQTPNSNADDELISLKSGPQVHRVRLSDILYISKQSNYLEVSTTEKKILIRANMSDIFSWLPETAFARIHKSHVVNLEHVSLIESNQVRISDVSLPIGASYRDDFIKRIT